MPKLKITIEATTPDNVEGFDTTDALCVASHLANGFADEVVQYMNAELSLVEVTNLDAQTSAVMAVAQPGEDLRDRFKAEPATAPDTWVWVCVFDHRCGINTWEFTTEAAAKAHRQRIAESYWHREMPAGVKKPDDAEEMADMYFEEMGDHGEYYSTYCVQLED